MQQTDVAILGGGIVGLATAYRITERFPDISVTVLEKEARIARHQTGHNSGVLHSGIYYRPGSLRATNCRDGKKAMQDFCEREGIAYELCGKVIVAVADWEVLALERIYERGQANGVQCELIEQDRLHELEPHATGIRAIHVPESGIVDFVEVCERLAQRVSERSGTVVTGARVTKIDHSHGQVHLETTAGDFEAQYLVNCTGLHCDRVTRAAGQDPDTKIVPFRGEYYELVPGAHHLCRALIYPVPDPRFPFLGVHFTRLIHGGVECGPNAVLAFAREGYRKRDINLVDLFESLTYPGFLRIAARHWRMGMGEMWRSVSKRAFVKALQRLMPEVRKEHLKPVPAGVRAQALGRDGALVDDFLVRESERMVHVLNAPSPAATASLNIGNLIAEKLATRF